MVVTDMRARGTCGGVRDIALRHEQSRTTERRAMGDSGASDPETSAPRGWSRASADAFRPRCSEWHPLGATHRGSLGRLAGSLSFGLYLLPPLLTLGEGGRAEEAIGGGGSRPGRTRRHRSLRVLHRRHLHGGEKRGLKVGKTKRGKGTKLMVIADASGLPLAVHTASASPHEVTLVEATLAETFTVGRPGRLIGDRAYDSDPLDQKLAAQGIELIAPHRGNRTRPATQDGRPLRRYRRRWKIERLFAWLNKYKRVITRWDRCHERFTAFVHLAFSMILLRRVQAFMK